ncbi:MAG: hypothetical protein AB7W59_01260 [Acidimicrobiia bacterium]
MSACCAIPAVPLSPCPSCTQVGPIVGVAPVKPHRHNAAGGPWQHCPTPDCPVVYYLDADIVDTDEVVAQVDHKATARRTPVCFCFAHTAGDLIADASAHAGVSTIKAVIRQAVADGQCACEHLNPSRRCCLADIHRILKAATARTSAPHLTEPPASRTGRGYRS